MPTWLRVPSLAENVNEATLARWLAEEGQALAAGDPVAEWITEKAQFTFETEVAGRLTARLAPERSVLPVGAIMAVLDGDDSSHAAAREENDFRVRQHAETLGLGAGTGPPEENGGGTGGAPARSAPPDGVRATPAARRPTTERTAR